MSFIWLLLAQQDAEEAGLAGTVATEKTDPFPVTDFKAGLMQELRTAVGQTQILYAKEYHEGTVGKGHSFRRQVLWRRLVDGNKSDSATDAAFKQGLPEP